MEPSELSCVSKSWNLSTLMNRTRFNNEPVQLPEFACQYSRAVNVNEKVQYYSGVVKIVGCFIGVISSVASLITFTRKPFRMVSFSYHCMINAADLLDCFMFLDDGLSYILKSYEYTPDWVRMRAYFTTSFNEVCQYWVNLLIVWVAFDRYAACMSPWLFRWINTKRAAAIVAVLTFLIAVGINSPDTVKPYKYYDPTTGASVEIYSAFRKSAFYKSYQQFSTMYGLVIDCCTVVATGAVVVGLARMYRRKRKLANFDGAPADMDRHRRLKECSLTIQLCVLQLCESLPLIVHETLHFIHDQVVESKSPDFITKLPMNLRYEEAVDKVNAFVVGRYLWLALRVASMVSHCFHFYWYIIFSPRVRNYILERRRNGVGPSITKHVSTRG